MPLAEICQLLNRDAQERIASVADSLRREYSSNDRESRVDGGVERVDD